MLVIGDFLLVGRDGKYAENVAKYAEKCLILSEKSAERVQMIERVGGGRMMDGDNGVIEKRGWIRVEDCT